MPKDRVTQAHQGYGFIEFMSEEDADYAIKIMNMIKLYGKPIRVNKVGFYFVLSFLLLFAVKGGLTPTETNQFQWFQKKELRYYSLDLILHTSHTDASTYENYNQALWHPKV